MSSKIKILVTLLILLCAIVAIKEVSAEEVDYKAKYEQLQKDYDDLMTRSKDIARAYLGTYKTYLKLMSYIATEQPIILRDKDGKEYKYICRGTMNI